MSYEYHGEARRGHYTAEYEIWRAMKGRCYNPNNISFPRYGARGVKVCRRWRRSFTAFLTDVGRRPSSRHSLDRWPDKHGNYEPNNCRWATRREQGANTRSNKLISFGGRTQHLEDWARELGVKHSTLFERIEKWPLRKALTTPKRNPNDGWTGYRRAA